MSEELAQTLKDCHEQILATQVQAMADVIRTMSKEFSPGVRLTGNVEDQILRAFPDADFRSVTALYTSDGFEVSGQRARCCSDQKFCTEVARLCSQLNGKQYAVISRRCVPSRMMCGFTVGPSPKYLLQVETAMRARSGVSGDNEMVFPFPRVRSRWCSATAWEWCLGPYGKPGGNPLAPAHDHCRLQWK